MGIEQNSLIKDLLKANWKDWNTSNQTIENYLYKQFGITEENSLKTIISCITQEKKVFSKVKIEECFKEIDENSFDSIVLEKQTLLFPEEQEIKGKLENSFQLSKEYQEIHLNTIQPWLVNQIEEDNNANIMAVYSDKINEIISFFSPEESLL